MPVIGEVLPTYACSNIGAPFEVELVDSVLRHDGAVTIPALGQMLATVAATRLQQAPRLAGGDLRFLRKVAARTAHRVASSAGIGSAEYEAYERDDRPMAGSIEKYLRIYFYVAVRKALAQEQGSTDALARHMDFVFEAWQPRPTSTDTDRTIRLAHTAARGWRRVR